MINNKTGRFAKGWAQNEHHANVVASPEPLAAGIGNTWMQELPRGRVRNTDRDWELLGATNPFYGVLAHDQYKAGCLDRTAQAEFFASGEQDIKFVLGHLHVVGALPPFGQALDFGCGLGRLTLIMTQHSRHVVGVDVSPDMIKRAASRAKEQQIGNVEFSLRIPQGQFDWINSYIV